MRCASTTLAEDSVRKSMVGKAVAGKGEQRQDASGSKQTTATGILECAAPSTKGIAIVGHRNIGVGGTALIMKEFIVLGIRPPEYENGASLLSAQ